MSNTADQPLIKFDIQDKMYIHYILFIYIYIYGNYT